MTLLTIIQDACERLGFDAPTFAIGNTEPLIKQMVALSNASGKGLAHSFGWQELTQSATHTTVAAELQGAVDTILPGFNWYVYETMWNRDTRVSVGGPLFPSEWQFLKASNVTGPFPEFRIQNKNLYFLPAPVAGQTIGLEYVGKYWCQSALAAPQERWAADTDTSLLSEEMLTLDLMWRFEARKGLDATMSLQESNIFTEAEKARSGARRVLNMSNANRFAATPLGLYIPDGGWETQ